MSTGTITGTVPWLTTSTQSETTTTTTEETMGKDDFLKLLVTQLKYQDPLEPMDNTQFLSQMATFSELEQMKNLNDTVSKWAEDYAASNSSSSTLQQVSTLIGREVAYLNSETSEEESSVSLGIIQSVIFREGTPYFIVGEDEVPMEDIIEIGRSSEDISSALLNSIDQALSKLAGENTEEEGENVAE